MPPRTSRLQTAATAVCLLVLLFVAHAAAQTSNDTIRYIYDEAGRLIAVVDPAGDTAVYSYDSVGNLLSISRQPAGAISVLYFTPKSGSVGTPVTIYGTGFGSTPGQNSVAFNGISATVTSVSSNEIETSVPAGATTGPITVTSPAGSVTTNTFTVTPGVTVSPSRAQLPLGGTLQFTANLTSIAGNQGVTWSVDGIDGGNSTVGTISPTGFYVAPGALTSRVTVSAKSVSAPSARGDAYISFINPDAAPLAVHAPALTVRRGLSASTSVAPSAGVAVQYGRPYGVVGVISGALGVRVGPGPGADSAASPAVTVTTGPHIASISPASVAKSTSTVVTISGANLTGTTALRFITSAGAVDNTITVANITVAPDGSTLTAALTPGGSTPVGTRVVVIATPTASSSTNNLSTNTINITP